MRNNFEQLADEMEAQAEKVKKPIKERIDGERNVFSFIGNIADLFIPKLFTFISELLGGSSSVKMGNDEMKGKYPNLDK